MDENLTLDQLKIILEKKFEENVILEDELRKLGIAPNPWVVTSIRMNVLMNFLMDERQRFEFEIESSDELKEILQSMLQQRIAEQAKQRLIVPSGLLPPGIHL